MTTDRNDVSRHTLSARDKFALSPRMKEQMQAIADARGIPRSQAWREAAAEYIAEHREGGDA